MQLPTKKRVAGGGLWKTDSGEVWCAQGLLGANTCAREGTEVGLGRGCGQTAQHTP